MSGTAVDADGKFASIDAMLHPKSIAIVGATERLQYGGRFLNNLIVTGCKAKLYPVNPKRDTIFGLPCYHSVLELPEPVDLAGIIVPAAAVVPTLRECAERGVKSALVISAGFAELGTEEGRTRQSEVQAVARETGVRVCGPNCLGLANVAESTWPCSPSWISPETVALYSDIGLVSQSGATGFGPLITTARDRGIGFRYIVSSGNEADLYSTDFIQYMLRDSQVSVVAALIEGFRDPAHFLQTAEMALEMGKPLIVLKVGRSEAGSRAASSHTAAMTGSDVVVDAVFKQKGVIRVDDYDELIETANMLLKAKPPRGDRVGVVSHSGGIGSLLADKLGEVGLELPPLSDRTRDGIGEILGERGSAANPADVTTFASNESFPTILNLLVSDPALDIPIIASASGELQARTAIQAAQESDKPLLFLWTGSMKDTATLPKLQASPLPVFYQPGKCARAVRRLVDYHRTRAAILDEKSKGVGDTSAREGGKALRDLLVGSAGKALTEYDSKRALSLFGVSAVGERLCASVDEAAGAAAEFGYPVVLKVVSPEITHKTEAGAVRLGIAGREELGKAHREMLSSVSARRPDARIQGVLVQPMVTGGVETIVGVSRDPQFGPVVMLGLGGVLVEAMGAASWRVCPVSRADARAMIGEVKGLPRILAGFRGQPKADAEALVEALVAISRLAVAAGERLGSLDVNPLVVLPEGRGVVALDALIVPDSSQLD